ncbi:MAG: ATP-binding protein [Gammaproteobacteria bacterium]|nr:ATP-binding protein [Gammaproteobacteria bacterium]
MFQRTLEQAIYLINKTFPVLLLTGPRQVGKTTLLDMCAGEGRQYVTLDDLQQRELARTDPTLFLQTHGTPLTIDEVQYAPELFSAIKLVVDKEKRNGLYWLTGSQKFHLMQGISESLAGRVAVLDLLGLSLAEIEGRVDKAAAFVPTPEWIAQARQHASIPLTVAAVFDRIWRGSFPKLNQDPEISRDIFYKSYIETYIQRDVRDIIKITDDLSFNKFVRACAARTGQLLNFSDLSRDADIDHKTAKSWLGVLETSGLVYMLFPYHSNVTKRLVKTPKLYFLDTGLCAYLTRWPNATSLEAGAMAGAILETWLIGEMLKSYWHHGAAAHFYFYRDQDQQEIDLLIETGDALLPVEFKKTASPARNAPKHFHVLNKLGKPTGHGAVICFVEKDVPLSNEVTAVPVGYL